LSWVSTEEAETKGYRCKSSDSRYAVLNPQSELSGTESPEDIYTKQFEETGPCRGQAAEAEKVD
jgi:hypothetical protein